MNNERLPILYFYKSVGFYYEQVKAYMDNFTGVKVCLYEDLVKYPDSLMKELYGFLDVDIDFKADTTVKRNVTPPVNNILQRVLFSENLRRIAAPVLFNTLGEKNSLRLYNSIVRGMKPKGMNPQTRERLIEIYREDVTRLQELTGRDLTHWLEY